MNNTERDKIIAKIKKCLALAKSSNEHEAAAALRQAQKLMQLHGIHDLDIANADMQEESTRAGARRTPARWECELAQRVARAFDCALVLVNTGDCGRWTFVGAAPSGEIARYAFEVLFRQVKRARAGYIKTALKRCATATRTRRADLFCDGWVGAATAQVYAWAGNEAARERAEAYLKGTHNPKQSEARNRNAGRRLSAREYVDKLAGRLAGKDAQLHRGVNGARAPLALEAQ